MSADFGPDGTTDYESTFCGVLEGVRNRGNQQIRQYRTHADLGRLMRELGTEYGNLLKYASYLLGHCAGLQATLKDAAPQAHRLINQSDLHTHLDEFAGSLETMWASYESWTSLEIFEALKKAIERVLNAAGVIFDRREGNQWHISVPFRPGTVPLWPF